MYWNSLRLYITEIKLYLALSVHIAIVTSYFNMKCNTFVDCKITLLYNTVQTSLINVLSHVLDLLSCQLLPYITCVLSLVQPTPLLCLLYSLFFLYYGRSSYYYLIHMSPLFPILSTLLLCLLYLLYCLHYSYPHNSCLPYSCSHSCVSYTSYLVLITPVLPTPLVCFISNPSYFFPLCLMFPSSFVLT